MTSEEEHVLIARIDERVETLIKTLPLLASCESVDAVKEKLNTHIENSRWSTGTVIACIASAASVVSVIALVLSK